MKKIIVSTKTLREPVHLKCSNKTGTSKAIEPQQEQSSIKTACSTEEVHNSVSKERGSYFAFYLDLSKIYAFYIMKLANSILICKFNASHIDKRTGIIIPNLTPLQLVDLYIIKDQKL